MKKVSILVTFILLAIISMANTRIDSLEQVILKSQGKEKVDAILLLGGEYQYSDYTRSLKYAQDALFISEKINYKKGIAIAKMNVGYSLTDLGRYSKAIESYQASLILFKELKDENNEAICYNDIGYIYQTQGLINNAIDSYLKSLKILEKLDDQKSTAACLNNIGLLYHEQANFEKALEYYIRSYEIKKTLDDIYSTALSLNNIGSLYFSQNDFVQAKDYFFESLQMRKQIDDKKGIAQSLTNISGIYREQKKYDIALEYLNQAQSIQQEINDPVGLANTINLMGVIYNKKDDTKNAEIYVKKAYNMAHEIGSPQQIQSSALALSILYRKIGKHQEAYPLLLEHKKMSDSLMNTENTRKLTQAGMQYEFERRLHESELKQLKKDHDHEIEMKEQKIISYSFAIGAGALIILSIVILKSLQDKKKANKQITQQKLEIEEQSFKLSEALENITDSVKYAQRIQDALLQNEEHVSNHFPEHFILFKPKDIVSGDFYWSYENGDNFYLAAVDCTGHGVPGALMSMLGISFLNNINAQNDNISPGEILDLLRTKVVEELNQTGKDWSSRDGMDISLAKINFKLNEIEWAGANNPLWIVKDGELEEIKGDRQAINYNENPKLFTNHKIELKKGNLLYMFSDGFADQFGGEKGKKFKYSSLKQLIQSISKYPLDKQKEELATIFEDWKGSLEQVDDVCIIGVKI